MNQTDAAEIRTLVRRHYARVARRGGRHAPPDAARLNRPVRHVGTTAVPRHTSDPTPSRSLELTNGANAIALGQYVRARPCSNSALQRVQIANPDGRHLPIAPGATARRAARRSVRRVNARLRAGRSSTR